MTVRIIKPDYEHIHQGMKLAKQMHAESSYGFLPFDEEKVEGLAGFAMDSEDYCILVAVDDANKVYGFFLGVIVPYYFCNEGYAVDLALFVSPDKRGVCAAQKLIAAFKQWAIAEGAREITLATSTGVEPERTAKLYERLGFPQIGTVHKIRVE